MVKAFGDSSVQNKIVREEKVTEKNGQIVCFRVIVISKAMDTDCRCIKILGESR